MPAKRKSTASPESKNISIHGDVKDSVVIAGNNNTIIQKFFNIFKSDSETLEQRNRRILLGHVENAWIKGVLDASLHGAALLDLGIKQDPEAVTKYPWAIKKESTDETLPAGLSMLEIFDSIGMGRSLLILGAPGSGKTTMLLELARQLIARAREDVTQPIPMVFNLASWTEKFTLADWLAQELNNLYSVPRKTAPDWVQGDKLLLLLDGLDEVRQENRSKCVEAINAFRKEHGMTSLAVCSRSQDYADLNAKLSFEGAIEVQLLTQKQIIEFFNRFGDEMTGIKQALEKDSALREMAETPLFLSIMVMAYRDKQDVDILVSQDEKAQRKHLFDTYIERMFERPRSKKENFKKRETLLWLSKLSVKMIAYNQTPFAVEHIQPNWLDNIKQMRLYKLFVGFISGLMLGLFFWISIKLEYILNNLFKTDLEIKFGYLYLTMAGIVLAGVYYGLALMPNEIKIVDTLNWHWKSLGIKNNKNASFQRGNIVGAGVALVLFGLFWGFQESSTGGVIESLFYTLGYILFFGIFIGLIYSLFSSLKSRIQIQQIEQVTAKGDRRVLLSLKNYIIVSLFGGLCLGLLSGVLFGLFGVNYGIIIGLMIMIIGGPILGLSYGGSAFIQHYTLRFILARNNLLPWKLVPFLDHCVDLIFLRRVGGGYIFVHRLLMEHFAEMYVETPTSKGN